MPELAQQLECSELHTTLSGAVTRSTGSHDRTCSSMNLFVQRKRSIWSSNPWRHLAAELKQHAVHHREEVRGETDTQAEAVCPGLPQNHCTNGQTTEALVYMSRDFQEDSEPRDEYVDRMNAGIIDACKLGMSDLYIDNCLRRCIPYRRLPKQGSAFAQHRSPQS